MLSLFIFSVFLTPTIAHLPLFPDTTDVHVPRAQTHSFAVYFEAESATVHLPCEENTTNYASVSAPYWVKSLITMHFNESISCSSKYDGWSYPEDDAYNAASLDAPLFDGYVWEPFGGSMYRKKAACKWTCSGPVEITVEAPSVLPFSVGMGKEEKFFDDIDIILTMRLAVLKIYEWNQMSDTVRIWVPLVLFLLSVMYTEYYSDKNREEKLKKHIGSALKGSAFYFAITTLYFAFQSWYVEEAILTSLTIHCVVPLLVLATWRWSEKRLPRVVATLVLLSVSLFVVWGDFYATPLLCLLMLYVYAMEYLGLPARIGAKIPFDHSPMKIKGIHIAT